MAPSPGRRPTPPRAGTGPSTRSAGGGFSSSIPRTRSARVAKDKDWNDYVITAMGDHITVSINGTVVNDMTDPKFEKSGVIGLQVHAGAADGGPVQGRRDQDRPETRVSPR